MTKALVELREKPMRRYRFRCPDGNLVKVREKIAREFRCLKAFKIGPDDEVQLDIDGVMLRIAVDYHQKLVKVREAKTALETVRDVDDFEVPMAAFHLMNVAEEELDDLERSYLKLDQEGLRNLLDVASYLQADKWSVAIWRILRRQRRGSLQGW